MVAGFRRVLGALLLCNGIESVEELLGNARQSGHETSDRRVHSAQHRRNENLAAGQIRQGYNTGEDWMEQAAADFNQVIAYLTELYSSPTTYALTFDDGREPETLTAPLSAAQFGAEGVDGCAAYGHELEGTAISVRLEDSYGGALFVDFIQKPGE